MKQLVAQWTVASLNMVILFVPNISTLVCNIFLGQNSKGRSHILGSLKMANSEKKKDYLGGEVVASELAMLRDHICKCHVAGWV